MILAITESGLLNSVLSGENFGRTLRHTAVVRKLEIIGKARSGQAESFTAERSVKPAKDWRRENLRAVVLVQDRETWRIVAAGSIPLATR